MKLNSYSINVVRKSSTGKTRLQADYLFNGKLTANVNKWCNVKKLRDDPEFAE